MVTSCKKSLIALFTVVTLSTNLAIAKQQAPLKKLNLDQEKGLVIVQDPANPMLFHIEVTPDDIAAPAVDLDPNYNYDLEDGSLSDAAEELVVDVLDTTAAVVGVAADVAGDALSAGANAAGQLIDSIENQFTAENGQAVVEALQNSANFVGEQAVAFEAAIENVAGNIASEITDLANAGMPAFQDAVTNAAHAIGDEAQKIANNKYVVRIKNAICSAFTKAKAFAENNHGKITTALAAAVVYLLYHNTNGK